MPWARAVLWGWRQARTTARFAPKSFKPELKCTAVWATVIALARSLTSHYLGPLINWAAPNGMTLSFSPQFGLNDYSLPRLYRFGVSYEIDQLFSRFHRGAQ